MKAALIQMCSTASVDENIKTVAAAIGKAAAGGAKFIATPEMTHLLERDAKALRKKVTTEDREIALTALSDLAKQHGITLLIGSMAIARADGKIANRSFLFDSQGQITARYDKINLFEAAISKTETYREADTYAAGDTAVIANVDDLQAGLTICYDLRFPEIFRQYAQAEVDMITVPAAFTVATGKAHWETLLRARAIETGAYILAPAQGGKHEDGRKTWGRSMVVDPWGEIVAKLDHDKPDILYATLDSKKITAARAKIPAWRGRI